MIFRHVSSVFTLVLISSVAQLAYAAPPRLAVPSRSLASQAADVLTPPMGWTSWNHFACRSISETNMKAQAEAMVASGMRDLGYRYINIDDCWQSSRSANGIIQADPQKFPSGMKALADFMHARGLKLGLYTDRGLKTCEHRPGSFGHEDQDAKTYAAWGIDYLKEDNCFLPTPKPPAIQSYEKMFSALKAAGRPIVLSLCNWGEENVWNWGAKFGNLWRTNGDIRDEWASLLTNFDLNLRHASKAHPGGWNDPDGLEIGNGGMTAVEYQTQMNLWALSAAPLMAGNDLTKMDAKTLELLTNRDVIAVDQDLAGRQGTLVEDAGRGLEIYSKPLSEPGARAVVVLNRSSSPRSGSVRFSTLGLEDSASVRDLWSKQTAVVLDRLIAIKSLAPHASQMFRVEGQTKQLPAGFLYLSDLGFESQSIGWGRGLKRDRSIDGHALSLNGKTYTKGLAAHADSELLLQLDRSQCLRFSGEVGVDDEVKGQGRVVFQVWGDDQKLFETATMRAGDNRQVVSINIAGIARLRLVALATGSEIRLGHADWADAKIECKTGPR